MGGKVGRIIPIKELIMLPVTIGGSVKRLYVGAHARVGVCACVRARARACVCVCSKDLPAE